MPPMRFQVGRGSQSRPRRTCGLSDPGRGFQWLSIAVGGSQWPSVTLSGPWWLPYDPDPRRMWRCGRRWSNQTHPPKTASDDQTLNRCILTRRSIPDAALTLVFLFTSSFDCVPFLVMFRLTYRHCMRLEFFFFFSSALVAACQLCSLTTSWRTAMWQKLRHR